MDRAKDIGMITRVRAEVCGPGHGLISTTGAKNKVSQATGSEDVSFAFLTFGREHTTSLLAFDCAWLLCSDVKPWKEYIKIWKSVIDGM